MRKTCKIFLVTIITVLVVIFLAIVFLNLLWKKDLNRFDYKSSEAIATRFLDENIDDLNNLAQDYLNNHKLKSKTFKIVTNIKYNKNENIFMKQVENVEFECNAQGMLGGQYWGLLYIPNNNYLGEKDLYIYDEKEIDNTGNNIFIRKKIRDNWFFYYDDFDGKVNIEDVK